MSGEGAPGDAEPAVRDAVPTGVEAVTAELKRAEEAVEELRGECARLSEEAEKVRADAAAAAAKVKEAAAVEAAEILRDARAEREALTAEMSAMCAFQTSKIKLDVGGHTFVTSKTTLTSVTDTYLEAMFSGRFLLIADAMGAYFIDRNGDLFRHILSYLRDPGRERKYNCSPRHRVSLNSGWLATTRVSLKLRVACHNTGCHFTHAGCHLTQCVNGSQRRE